MARGKYRPLAVSTPWSSAVDQARAGKQPLTEVVDGHKMPWTEGHSHHRLMYVTAMSANTGLLLGGTEALTALDIDPAKDAVEADPSEFVISLLHLFRTHVLWPQLRAALWRTREPASRLCLLRADKPMSKLKVSGQRGAVELLGQGQQCVVHGWHPRSLAGQPVRWQWHAGRAPWTVPAAELPVVAAAELQALMQQITDSGILGLPRTRTANTTVVTGRVCAGNHDATTRLRALFDTHNGLVRPAIRDLVQQIGAEGCGRHDAVVAITGRLVMQKWSDSQVSDFLAPLVNEHFGDGDWTDEIDAALAHARKRDGQRVQRMRGVIWQ
jgi:hypothetical protein